MLYSEFVTGTGIENHDLYECVEKVYNDDNDMTKEEAYYIAKLIDIRPSTHEMYFQVKLEYEQIKINKKILKKEKELEELKSKLRCIQSILNYELYGQIDDWNRQ